LKPGARGRDRTGTGLLGPRDFKFYHTSESIENNLAESAFDEEFADLWEYVK